MDTDRLVVGEGTLNHYWTLCFADETMRHKLGLRIIDKQYQGSAKKAIMTSLRIIYDKYRSFMEEQNASETDL